MVSLDPGESFLDADFCFVTVEDPICFVILDEDTIDNGMRTIGLTCIAVVYDSDISVNHQRMLIAVAMRRRRPTSLRFFAIVQI